MGWQYEGIRAGDHIWKKYDQDGYVVATAWLNIYEMPADWSPGNNPPAAADRDEK